VYIAFTGHVKSDSILKDQLLLLFFCATGLLTVIPLLVAPGFY